MTQSGKAHYWFCGKAVGGEDLDLISETVNDFGLPRSEIANTVCELLEWTRPNGKLKTVECLKFLVMLESEGLFSLPAPKNRHAAKPRKAKRTEAGGKRIQLSGPLKEIGPITVASVKTQTERDLWKELVDRHHYLGYRVPFGASLRYFIETEKGLILGCLQFSSPAWKVKVRDEWLGWCESQREKNLQRIVQNSRYLILPDVRVKGLASHVLGKAAKRIAVDWEKAYKVKPVLMETFVDEARFAGTCYRAANWQKLGRTSGRGRMDRYEQAGEPVKTVWVYPLTRNWRKALELAQ